MEIIYRNANIMQKRHYATGLKEVFLKLEELLTTELGQAELHYLIGNPYARQGNMFMPHSQYKIAE